MIDLWSRATWTVSTSPSPGVSSVAVPPAAGTEYMCRQPSTSHVKASVPSSDQKIWSPGVLSNVGFSSSE